MAIYEEGDADAVGDEEELVLRYHFKPSEKVPEGGWLKRKKSRRVGRRLLRRSKSTDTQSFVEYSDSEDEYDEPHGAVKLEKIEQQSKIQFQGHRKAIRNWANVRSKLIQHLNHNE